MQCHIFADMKIKGPGHEHAHAHPATLSQRIKHAVVPHSHDAQSSIQSAQEASRAGIRAAWISLVGMAIVAIVQVAIVAVSGSIALLADTIHNAGHLVTTIPLLLAFRLGQRPPTATYTFGFRRAEDLSGVLIAAVIALSAVWIIVEAILGLIAPRPLTNLGWVFAAGLVGAVGNEIVAMYRIRVGRQIGSEALIAEGRHARADALTSVAVVLGVVGVWFGLPRADAAIGLVIAVVILTMLAQTVRSITRRLMDGVEPHIVAHVAEAAGSVGGVRAVSAPRARWSGHRLEVQLDVELTGGQSLEAADRVVDEVVLRIRSRVQHVDQVIVRPRPTQPGSTFLASESDRATDANHHRPAEARQ